MDGGSPPPTLRPTTGQSTDGPFRLPVTASVPPTSTNRPPGIIFLRSPVRPLTKPFKFQTKQRFCENPPTSNKSHFLPFVLHKGVFQVNVAGREDTLEEKAWRLGRQLLTRQPGLTSRLYKTRPEPPRARHGTSTLSATFQTRLNLSELGCLPFLLPLVYKLPNSLKQIPSKRCLTQKYMFRRQKLYKKKFRSST